MSSAFTKGIFCPTIVLDAVDGFLAGVAEIVGDDDVIARLDELYAGVAADVAGAAGNENGHI